MRRWSGTVAFLNTETVDGRILKMDTLPSRHLPLVLLGPGKTAVCVQDWAVIGGVDDVLIEGNEVRASGWINLDQVEETLWARLTKGEPVGAAIDVDGITTNEAPGQDLPRVFTQATLTTVRVGDNPAWSGSVIKLDGPS